MMPLPGSWIGRCAAVLCVLLALAACGGKEPKLPQLGPDDVVLAFGDSLTFGTGARDEESYPDVLAALINRKVVRAGVPGEVTAQGLRRLSQALDTHRPKIVLLCLGGNDMLRRLNDATIVANLRAMIAAARSRGTAVVLLGVPRPALFGGSATFYADLADEYGLVYEGDAINIVLRDPALKSDPIHPNANGYRRIAEAVAALLRQHGAL
ncbi:MAG: arylesterase [Burkholderiales bacterium]